MFQLHLVSLAIMRSSTQENLGQGLLLGINEDAAEYGVTGTVIVCDTEDHAAGNVPIEVDR